MFDVGWQELFIIALVALVVVGPKELPRVLRTVSLWARRARQMAREFQDGLDDLAREADIDDIRRKLEREATAVVEQTRSIDPTGGVRDAAREIEAALPELQGDVTTASAPVVEPQEPARPPQPAPSGPSNP